MLEFDTFFEFDGDRSRCGVQSLQRDVVGPIVLWWLCGLIETVFQSIV